MVYFFFGDLAPPVELDSHVFLEDLGAGIPDGHDLAGLELGGVVANDSEVDDAGFVAQDALGDDEPLSRDPGGLRDLARHNLCVKSNRVPSWLQVRHFDDCSKNRKISSKQSLNKTRCSQK